MKTYSVFLPHTNKWLADDEKTWTDDFLEAAQFTNTDLAADIATRECEAGTVHMVVSFDT